MLVEAVVGLTFLVPRSLREGMEAVGQVGIFLVQQPLQLRQIPVAAVAVADRAPLERVQQARLALLFFVI
jgi:hypothetical protein